ncbi:MAG TPA: hypothetical protein VK541_16415 [Pedobacter sp.]|uniref:hypothetical protein n=1 Tax=Pedobacter sp. TaxID=1411316 RepID=UPI002C2E539D|nr:hypothetical protein [Pedobacter sp.]HMI04072.1 hypothetical protein [Pedobacter sp.]
MEPTWNILQAMQYCPYKAWQLSQQTEQINNLTFPGNKLTAGNRLALTAYALASNKETNQAANILQVYLENGLKSQTIRLKPSANPKSCFLIQQP